MKDAYQTRVGERGGRLSGGCVKARGRVHRPFSAIRGHSG